MEGGRLADEKAEAAAPVAAGSVAARPPKIRRTMAEAGGRAPLAPTPLSHHRPLGELGGGTQASQRLLAYSDALFSIIATVMVSVEEAAAHRRGF